MWNRINKFFTSKEARKKWDLLLPVLFISYLFAYLFWQLHSYSSFSGWLESNGRVIWHIKLADNALLQGNPREFRRQIDKIEDVGVDRATRKELRLIEDNMERPRFVSYRLERLLRKHILIRQRREMEFQTNGLRYFVLATMTMLVLSILFLRHWIRGRRLAHLAAESEQKQRWRAELSQLLTRSLEPRCLKLSVAEYSLGRFADVCALVSGKGEFCVLREGMTRSDVHWGPVNKEVARDLIQEVQDRPSLCVLNALPSDLIRFPFSVDVTSFILLPLRAGKSTLGTVVFMRYHRNYTEEERRFIEDLIGRTSLALDNARLYQLSEESSKTRNELMRVVSHDLKNPLNSIKLNGELLLHHCSKMPNLDPRLHQRLSSIINSSEHAISLINDLLVNAKIEEGGLVLKKNTFAAIDLVNDLHDLFQSLAEEKGVLFTIDYPHNAPLILHGDQDLILQALSNLLGNALKYTPKGGLIQLTMSQEGEELLFHIQDNGPGIPEDRQKNLFKRYWRDESTGHLNLGLGLSIAKSAVEAHGGRIWMVSEVGKGCSFFFTLPLERPDTQGLMFM